MSKEELHRELNDLVQTGDIDNNLAKEAAQHPLAGENLVRLVKVEQQGVHHGKQIQKVEQALFGDEKLQLSGVVHDTNFLKRNFWRGIWTLAGAMSVLSFLLGALGLYLEAKK